MTRIKICGLTRQEDLSFSEDMGAWALGFIFHAKSPRFIEPQLAGELKNKSADVLRVGVFVNSSKIEILSAVKDARLSAVQLHGEETPEFCQDLKTALPEIKLIKAFRFRSEEELSSLPAYKMCDLKLVDAFVEGQPGGTGKIARWDLAVRAKSHGELILSGGLTNDNIGQAFGQVRPYAFDVSSGVEDRPGIKNHSKIRAFFQMVRTYEERS